MEDIEQLNSMYEAHYPNVWSSVESGQDLEVQRLMNGTKTIYSFLSQPKTLNQNMHFALLAWVKVTALRNSVRLLDLAKKNAGKTKSYRNVLETLETNSLMIDLAHAIFSNDTDLFKQLSTRIGADFNPNMADFSYCFSWYRSVGRNLPRFILEIALDTKNAQIVNWLLDAGCDVNLYHTKSGNPFYYSAFEEEFQCIKDKLMSAADLAIKNQRGQNVLFYIVFLYANSQKNSEYDKQLISDFNRLLTSDAMLLVQRDQDEVALIESIICMPPALFKRAVVFLKELSDHLLRIVHDDNPQIVRNMVLRSYALTLIKSPVFPQNTFKPSAFKLAGNLTFEEYIEQKNLKQIKRCIMNFEDHYINMLCQFRQAIKIGDLTSISSLMEGDKKKWLVYSRDYSGRSCLHLAVLYGQASVVK